MAEKARSTPSWLGVPVKHLSLATVSAPSMVDDDDDHRLNR